MSSIRAHIVHWFLKAIRADAQYSSVDAARKNMQKSAAIQERPLKVPKLTSRVVEEACAGFPVYWLRKENDAGKSAILYLHGGAFIHQPSYIHWKYADRIARATGLPLALAVYPKAPAHQFTDAYDYLAEVYREMWRAGYTDITIMGDSSGATLTLGLTVWLAQHNLPMPARIIPISPCVDLSLSNPDIAKVKRHDPMLAVPGLHEIVRVWSGSADLQDYRLSPLYGDIGSLPPTLIIAGSYEILCPDIRMFAEQARQTGAPVTYHEYAEMLHVFPLMPIPEAKMANREILAFIRQDMSVYEAR